MILKSIELFALQDREIASVTLGCILASTSKNEENKQRLGSIGVCDFIVKILKSFGKWDPFMAKQVCGTFALFQRLSSEQVQVDLKCAALIKMELSPACPYRAQALQWVLEL